MNKGIVTFIGISTIILLFLVISKIPDKVINKVIEVERYNDLISIETRDLKIQEDVENQLPLKSYDIKHLGKG